MEIECNNDVMSHSISVSLRPTSSSIAVQLIYLLSQIAYNLFILYTSTFMFVLASKTGPPNDIQRITCVLISLRMYMYFHQSWHNRKKKEKKRFDAEFQGSEIECELEYNRSINKSTRAAFTQYVNDKDKNVAFVDCSLHSLKVDIHLFLLRVPYHYCVSE